MKTKRIDLEIGWGRSCAEDGQGKANNQVVGDFVERGRVPEDLFAVTKAMVESDYGIFRAVTNRMEGWDVYHPDPEIRSVVFR